MASQVLSKAATGASLGAAAGPYGAAIGAAVGAGYGIWQGYQAKKLEEEQGARPIQEVPQAVRDNMTLAQQRALEGMPEAQKQAYLDHIMREQSALIGAANSRAGGLNTIASIGSGTNDALKNLSVADSNMRRENFGQQYAANAAGGVAQQNAFQFNKVNPYYESAAAIRALKGASAQNINNAAQAAGYYLDSRSSGQSAGSAPNNYDPNSANPITPYGAWGANNSNVFNPYAQPQQYYTDPNLNTPSLTGNMPPQ